MNFYNEGVEYYEIKDGWSDSEEHDAGQSLKHEMRGKSSWPTLKVKNKVVKGIKWHWKYLTNRLLK